MVNMGDRVYLHVMNLLKEHGGHTPSYWEALNQFRKEEAAKEAKKLAQYEKIRAPLQNWAKNAPRSKNGQYLTTKITSTAEV